MQGLIEHPMLADGNCLFHAFSKKTSHPVNILRNIAAEGLRKNRAYYEPFFLATEIEHESYSSYEVVSDNRL
jgi:hypothetical protein